MAEENKPAAAQYPAPQPMKSEKLRDNIYLVTGGAGANTGFYIGKDSVVAVDSKMTGDSGRQFLEMIRKETGKPVGYMVLTHSDLDHVNGLTAFPRDMKIMAHVNTKRDMIDSVKMADPLFAAPQGYLPDFTFSDEIEFKIGADFIQLSHFGPGHTGGDVVVNFKKEKVVFAGDLITFGREPLIHSAKGGSSYGLVNNLQALLEMDADTFVPGHNRPCGKKEIEGLIKTIQERQAAVEALFKQGMTLDEVKKALNVQERPPLPSGFRFPTFVESIYTEIAGRK